MSEYYGAPNDFRNYLEHRMDDYRWSPNKHKGRKGNEYNGNQEGKDNRVRENKLRERFKRVANLYTRALDSDSEGGPEFDALVKQRLQSKYNIYQACLTTLRNNTTLSESQMDYIQQFIDSVESLSSSTLRPGLMPGLHRADLNETARRRLNSGRK